MWLIQQSRFMAVSNDYADEEPCQPFVQKFSCGGLTK